MFQEGLSTPARDWLLARLQFNENDGERVLKELEDEHDIEEAEDMIKLIKRLSLALSSVFPAPEVAEPMLLLHDDLSRHSILVNEQENFKQRWIGNAFPQFLYGRHLGFQVFSRVVNGRNSRCGEVLKRR
jgi:hypothetical protein